MNCWLIIIILCQPDNFESYYAGQLIIIIKFYQSFAYKHFPFKQ